MAYRFTLTDALAWTTPPNVQGATRLTLSLWYLPAINSNWNGNLAGTWGPDPNKWYRFDLCRPTPTAYDLRAATGDAAYGSALTGTNAVTLGAWTHLYLVFDSGLTGTSHYRLWINGSPYTSWATYYAPTRGITTIDAPWTVGGGAAGDLAEVALWTDVALDDATVIANLAAGRLPTDQTTGRSSLAFYAPLRSDTTAVVVPAGASGTPTVTGTPTVVAHPPTVDVYTDVSVPTLSVRVNEVQVGGETF